MFSNLLKIVSINIFVFLVLILLFELFLGNWLIRKDNYNSLLIPRQQTDILDNLPYKSEKLGLFTRDKNGFRSNTYNLIDVDILVIGGSTTEEREVDDNLIWTKIFEENLKETFKVLNAGIGGQTSYGHSLIYDLWFSKHTNLKPKYILVYLGINDALNLVESIDSDINEQKGRVINEKNKDLLINNLYYERLVQNIKNKSIIHNLYLILKGNILSRKYKITYNNRPMEHKAHVTSPPIKLNKISQKNYIKFKNFYNENLYKILELEKIYKSKVIFINQNVSNRHWIYPYVNIINLFTNEFCNKNNTTCFNIANEIEIHNTNYDLFYDGIHTTPIGSAKIGNIISNKFNKMLAR